MDKFIPLPSQPSPEITKMNYIDVFSGAGGLSEGFIREGFHPIAHVEMNKEAADTLKTRLDFII